MRHQFSTAPRVTGWPPALSLLYLPGSLYQRSTRVRSGNDKLHPWYESLAWLVTLIGITLVIAQPGWQQSGPVRCLTGQIPPIQTWPIMSVILSAPSTLHTPHSTTTHDTFHTHPLRWNSCVVRRWRFCKQVSKYNFKASYHCLNGSAHC